MNCATTLQQLHFIMEVPFPSVSNTFKTYTHYFYFENLAQDPIDLS